MKRMQCDYCGTVTGQHGFSFDNDKRKRESAASAALVEEKKEWFEQNVLINPIHELLKAIQIVEESN